MSNGFEGFYFNYNLNEEYDTEGNPMELDFSEGNMARSFKDFYSDKSPVEEDIDINFDDNELLGDDEIENDDSVAELETGHNQVQEKEKTRMERKKVRGRIAALKVATKGQWDAWDMKKKALFLSKFEYKEISPGKGRFVKRKKPKAVADVFKQLKKKAKKLVLGIIGLSIVVLAVLYQRYGSRLFRRGA